MVNMNWIILDNFLKFSLDEVNGIYSVACCGFRFFLFMVNFVNIFYEIYFLFIKFLVVIYVFYFFLVWNEILIFCKDVYNLNLLKFILVFLSFGSLDWFKINLMLYCSN